MKSKLLIIIIFITFIALMAGCEKKEVLNGGQEENMLMFGKKINITISEGEVVDAAHLQKVLEGKIHKDVPYFDLWNEKELKKMIDYMKKNDYMIIPGRYTFNQAWRFKDGMLVLNNGEKREVFKFQKSNNN